MAQTKRLPKHDFKINLRNILKSKKISTTQKELLIQILDFHKAKCKYGYKPISNAEFISVLETNKTTFTRNRNKLEDLKFIEIKIKQGTRMVKVERSKRKTHALHYYPQWQKLITNDFIELEEDKPNPYKKNYAKVVTPKAKKLVKEGEEITEAIASTFKDDEVYSMKVYMCDANENKYGSGVPRKSYGKDIKRNLKVQQDRKKRGQQESIYIFDKQN
ncbi:hypothetical protein TDCHD05_10451 [Tenacibaculum dicentrarchi]|nr:hypothetical protein TDCHD05_10451 [Tenacibaculum dicentrarchi]